MLQKLLLLEQPDRFRMAKAFIRAQGLGADAVAELVSDAVLQGLLASAQDLQPGESQDGFYTRCFLFLCLFLSWICARLNQETSRFLDRPRGMSLWYS